MINLDKDAFKDGADLLQMSSRLNLHISLTPDPLTLHAVGLARSLTKMGEQIAKLQAVRQVWGIFARVFPSLYPGDRIPLRRILNCLQTFPLSRICYDEYLEYPTLSSRT